MSDGNIDMNKELYERLEIDTNQELKDLLEAVEAKQMEYLQRVETANDEERRQELELLISKMDDEMEDLKKQIKAAKVAKKVENIKQEEAKKQEEERQKALEAQRQAQLQAEAVARNQKISGYKNQFAAPVKLRPVSEDAEVFQNILKDYYDYMYPEAFEALKPMAEAGSPSAMYVTGVMYQYGLGMNRDLARAKFWLEKAAKKGEEAAEEAYGKCVLRDQGSSPAEVKAAFRYLQNLADDGDREAMDDFVDGVLNGFGEKKYIGQAMKYCDKLKDMTGDSGYEVSKKSLQRMKSGGVAPGAGGNNGNNQPAPKQKKVRTSGGFSFKKLILAILLVFIVVNVFNHFRALKLVQDAIEARQHQKNKSEVTESSQAEENQQQLMINVGDANIRFGAGTDNQAIGLAHQGEIYTKTGQSQTAANGSEWYEIYLDNVEGYSTGWISEKVCEPYELTN